MRVRVALAAAVVAAALAGCAPIYRNHGYAPTEGDLAALTLGQDTRASVVAAVGEPATGGVLDSSTLYYVESRFRTYGLMAPREVEREVLALSFAADGTLGAIERFGLADGRVVPISRRVTGGVFANPGVIAQILANFGGLDPSAFLGPDAEGG